MGSKQSSLADSNKGYTHPSKEGGKPVPESVRGRKSTTTTVTVEKSIVTPPEGLAADEPSNRLLSSEEEANVIAPDADTTSDEEDSVYSNDEYDDDDEDEEWEERLAILEDARRLKQIATFFLHPEKPVQVDATATARCYFDRPSAPERTTMEDANEEALILEDLEALKKLAVDYMHPEKPVVTTDANACGRNYFSRASAPERETFEEAEAHAQVLADALQLKKLAVDYMHPENPVVTTDATACGRNYFSRASAPQQETEEEAEAHAQVMADVQQLKKLAVDYLHPELPVRTEDPTLFGRNYFSRPSAPEYLLEEEDEERARILEESKQLKRLAVDYMHPERPVVTTDATACGRNYFSRPSAPEQVSAEEAKERAQVLVESLQLKKLAVDYLHPERPVEVEDPTLFGRNYFSRASAPDQETEEDMQERLAILEETAQLKKLAIDYHHPELPVVTTDGTAFGRNYFTRPSAAPQESSEDAEERARILQEAAQLKKLAVDYHHPERPVVAEDPTLFGRNYFGRASAPEQESLEDSQERAQVLGEAMQLKKLAVDYKHPERPVVAEDPTLFGRNYFTRASAPEQESAEEARERALVLQDALQLKKLAVDYRHPERPVVTEDPAAVGRNFFSRASAPGHDQMVHSFPVHEDEAHHDEHDHHHVDHFGMDEDLDHMFDDMRQDLNLPSGDKIKPIGDGEEEEEGNLSRSPSSVMLFTGESVYD